MPNYQHMHSAMIPPALEAPVETPAAPAPIEPAPPPEDTLAAAASEPEGDPQAE